MPRAASIPCDCGAVEESSFHSPHATCQNETMPCPYPEEHHDYAPDLSCLRDIVEHAIDLDTQNRPEALDLIRRMIREHDTEAAYEPCDFDCTCERCEPEPEDRT